MKQKPVLRSIAFILSLALLFTGTVTPAMAANIPMIQETTIPPLFDPYELTGLTGWQEMLSSPGDHLPDPEEVVPKFPKVDLNTLNESDEDYGYIDPVTGIFSMYKEDLKYPSTGFSPSLSRSYMMQEGIKGLLGYGWNFSYDQYLEMYQDFVIMEYRGDGNHRTYEFTKDSPDLIVDSFDGDPLIYYPLDQGTYTEVSIRASLTRNEDGTYTVKDKDGFSYVYNGYKAPWRNQTPNAGRLLSISDPIGNTMSFSYDEEGNLSLITDTAGREIEIDTENGLIRKITDPIGREITYNYDANQNLKTVTYSDGSMESFDYDTSHRMTSYTDTLGRTYNYQYDSQNRMIRVEKQDGILVENIEYVTSDEESHAVIKNAKGLETKLYWNEDKKITRQTNNLGKERIYTYDDAGNKKSVTDQNGNTTSYENDDKNRKTKVTYPDGKTTEYSYEDNFDKLTKVINPDGSEISYTYDESGNLTSETDALGNETIYLYDEKGNITSVIDPKGNTTTYHYDAYGNLIELTNALGETIQFTYDAVGRILSQTSPKGEEETFSYDQRDRIKSVTNALGSQTNYSYNAEGKITAITDAKGNEYQFQYDISGKLEKVTAPNGNSQSYTYYDSGLVRTAADSLGNTHTFSYNARGQVDARIKIGQLK